MFDRQAYYNWLNVTQRVRVEERDLQALVLQLANFQGVASPDVTDETSFENGLVHPGGRQRKPSGRIR